MTTAIMIAVVVGVVPLLLTIAALLCVLIASELLRMTYPPGPLACCPTSKFLTYPIVLHLVRVVCVAFGEGSVSPVSTNVPMVLYWVRVVSHQNTCLWCCTW